MAANVYIFSPIRSSSFRLDTLFPITHLQPIFNSPCCSLSVARSSTTSSFGLRLGATRLPNRSRKPPAALMLPENPVASDILAVGLSGCIALSLLRLWGETANRRIFDQMCFTVTHTRSAATKELSGLGVMGNASMPRKLVHMSVGLVFMICWPMFSPGPRGAILAALIPGINIIRMLLLGLGIMKDEAIVKSMSRNGDYRELLKGPLYYAATITLTCIIYWRTSPITIAVICNLCAGDGLADIIGRRFGSHKIPYNKNKSVAGSVAMASAGFLASIGYMHYFSSFGFLQESSEMVIGFLVVSLASALVESLPISTELDDNLTVPLTSIFVGTLVF